MGIFDRFFKPNVKKMKRKVDPVEWLIEIVTRGYSDARCDAVKMLGEIGDARAVGPLLSVLETEDAGWEASHALGKIGEPAVEPLINALRDDSAWVREKAADALGKIGGTRAVEALIESLEDSSGTGVRSTVRDKVADALGAIGDARAVEPLIKTLKDSSWPHFSGPVSGDLWHSGAGALGKIGEPAVEPLINALRDSDDDVRLWAVVALGATDDKRAVEPLIKMLKDDEDDIRMRAADALGYIGDHRAVKPLRRALKDESQRVRAAAGHALVDF